MKRKLRTILLVAFILTPIPAFSIGDFCTDCFNECDRQADEYVDSCVRSGNDWYKCAAARQDVMYRCGYWECPVCNWLTTYCRAKTCV